MNEPSPAIIGLGEILWDVFPDGARFGGAPANLACHVAALGHRAQMVGSVGRDDLGRRALAELSSRGVGIDSVHCDKDRATGVVTVSLDDNGVASYEFASDTAWDALPWSDDLARLAARTPAVCFGTLAQRSEQSRETIRRFVLATPSTSLRVFDVNLRPPFVSDGVIRESLDWANVLKLNDEELPVLAALCDLSGSEVQIIEALADRFSLRAVALTRGPDGAVLLCDGRLSDQPGIETQVVDTVGAGDAYTAVLTIGLVEGRDLDELNRHACRVAAFVCSQSGATPELRDLRTDV